MKSEFHKKYVERGFGNVKALLLENPTAGTYNSPTSVTNYKYYVRIPFKCRVIGAEWQANMNGINISAATNRISIYRATVNVPDKMLDAKFYTEAELTAMMVTPTVESNYLYTFAPTTGDNYRSVKFSPAVSATYTDYTLTELAEDTILEVRVGAFNYNGYTGQRNIIIYYIAE